MHGPTDNMEQNRCLIPEVWKIFLFPVLATKWRIHSVLRKAGIRCAPCVWSGHSPRTDPNAALYPLASGLLLRLPHLPSEHSDLPGAGTAGQYGRSVIVLMNLPQHGGYDPGGCLRLSVVLLLLRNRTLFRSLPYHGKVQRLHLPIPRLYKYNPQIQISAESETKRSIFREKDKTKRSKKESAQHSKSRNKSFVMTSVSAL